MIYEPGFHEPEWAVSVYGVGATHRTRSDIPVLRYHRDRVSKQHLDFTAREQRRTQTQADSNIAEGRTDQRLGTVRTRRYCFDIARAFAAAWRSS